MKEMSIGPFCQSCGMSMEKSWVVKKIYMT